ncbi:MAG: sialidase family protein [Fimbriimonadaceae bacterium]
MRYLSPLLLLSFTFLISGNAIPQTGPTDRGRLGIWYRSSTTGNLPDDYEGVVPKLERRTDSYLPPPIWRAFARPSNVIFGSFISRQVNVNAQGQNIIGDAANEPSLAVDPNNRNRIAVGWRQFDNVASNFRQAGNGYTTDGGNTWRSNTVFTPGTFRSDPVLGVDAAGKFYYNSLMETFFDDVWGSTNGGASWLNLGPATGGDKQWMTIDRSNSTGKGFLYQAWSTAGNNYGGRQFSRSTNGSATWMDPINIPTSPVWGTLDFASNGDLYVCGMSNPFTFLRSSNAKNAAVTPTFDRVTSVEMGGSIVFGSFVNPAGLLGQCWIATDRSTGANKGNIYMLCSVGVDNANPCDVNFVRSTNGGLTWSAPRRLNSDPANRGAHHWFGTLSVAPNGRLDACWNDSRANPGTPLSALYFCSSFDGGLTWTPNVQVSPVFNPSIGYPNQDKMGDYIGMVSDNGGADIAYAATHNGEEDIWHLRIPAMTGFAGDATGISVYQGSYRAGTLSSIWSPDISTYNVYSAFINRLGQSAAVQTDYLVPTGVTLRGLKLRVSTSSATSGMVWLYNWTTNKYDVFLPFQISASGFTDATVNFPGSSAPYISPTGTVRAIFRALAPIRTTTVPPFMLRIDLERLLVG